MKKLLMMVAFSLLSFSFASVASAQEIVKDSLAPDGTRVVVCKHTDVVCSTGAEIHIYKNKITYAEIFKGCSGNTQGVCRLVEGMKVKDAIAKIDGIQCGKRPTSCPDQLAWALKYVLENKKGPQKK